MSEKIRILIVDDHFFVRMGLRDSLNDEDDLEVVSEASNHDEALAAYDRERPDIVLMDLKMPGKDGVETAAAIRERSPEAKLIMVSVDEAENDIYRSVEAGAKGYLPKSIDREELLEAIHCVHDGESYFPAQIAQRLAAYAERPELTDREMQVLELIVQGHSNKEAAAKLGVTEPTIKQHAGHVYKKLNVLDRTQAVTAAIQRGIVKLD
ncbi:MAG: response regulator [Limisphaerales bacterium]